MSRDAKDALWGLGALVLIINGFMSIITFWVILISWLVNLLGLH